VVRWWLVLTMGNEQLLISMIRDLLIGRCDRFQSSREVHCNSAFLPSQDIWTVVEETLRGSLRRRRGAETIARATRR
jgi:hypothetical protein